MKLYLNKTILLFFISLILGCTVNHKESNNVSTENTVPIKTSNAIKVSDVPPDTPSAFAAIQRKVTHNWIRPLTVNPGLTCHIKVILEPDGKVVKTSIAKTSGDMAFDRSAESAVSKASPLPIPRDKTLFEKNFKSFVFVFKPT